MDLLRSGLNIRCVTMGTDGLWLMLLKHAPSPEHREMESVIGAQRIRRNKNLRTEVVALREIFSDVAGLPFPELPVMAVAAAEALCKAVQGLLERIEDAYPLGCPITLVVVQRFSGEIQCTLDCEQRYLEDEALSLTMALDVETDSVSGRPHTACSTHSADSASERQSRVVEKNAGLCLEKPVHKASKVRSRLPCKYVAASFPALDGSSTSIRQSGDEITTHHGGKSDSPVRRSGSTFRNKLQAAKDENYFIDDYKLGVS